MSIGCQRIQVDRVRLHRLGTPISWGDSPANPRSGELLYHPEPNQEPRISPRAASPEFT